MCRQWCSSCCGLITGVCRRDGICSNCITFAVVLLGSGWRQLRYGAVWAGTMSTKERSKESMRGAILAKLIAVAKQRPEPTRPKVFWSKAITELIDLVESKVEGWIKRTAHLEKARTFQSALQQARNHQIDVSCLTVKEKDKKK